MKQLPDIIINIIRWVVYSIISFIIIIPFDTTIGEQISWSLLIGWFMGIGNEVITQLKSFNSFLNNKNDNNGKTEGGSR